MSARIELVGSTLEAQIRSLRGGTLQRALVSNLHDQAMPIQADMMGLAKTRIQRRAMDSVRIDKIAAGIEIKGGQGGGLAATLFPGAEFGGRESRKGKGPGHTPILYRSRKTGRPYTVMRRTTMQFRQHLGSGPDSGYFFWPTLRDWLPRFQEQAAEIVAKSVGGR